jgi:hypothetical protein
MTIAKDWRHSRAWRGGYERERDAYGDPRVRVNTVTGMVGAVFYGAAENSRSVTLVSSSSARRKAGALEP